MLQPLSQDRLKRRAPDLNVLAIAKRHETAVLGEPLQEARGVRDRHAGIWRSFASACVTHFSRHSGQGALDLLAQHRVRTVAE